MVMVARAAAEEEWSADDRHSRCGRPDFDGGVTQLRGDDDTHGESESASV